MPTSLTAEFVEREYNNRALVPDHPAYFARWEKDSAFVRATLPCELDVAYGPAPRHRIDLFPAANARGTLVFIHGGYWRSLDKSMFSWLAAPWVAAGVNVAMPNYRLAPTASIEAIVDDVRAALRWLAANGPGHRIAVDRIVVSGHSAGGHLTAAMLGSSRAQLQFDPRCIIGGVAISPVVDFEPLLLFSFNSDLRLDEASVQRLNLHGRKPAITAPLIVAAGGDESSEFVRQAELLAQSWPDMPTTLQILPGYNHFSIVDAFAERGQPLHEGALALFSGRS